MMVRSQACIIILVCACSTQAERQPHQATRETKSEGGSCFQAHTRIVERLNPILYEYVDTVLQSPWGAQYGLKTKEELDEHPTVHRQVDAIETALRNRLREVIDMEEGLLLVSPVSGHFSLLVEREKEFEKLEAELATRGDVVSSPLHDFKFGDRGEIVAGHFTSEMARGQVFSRLPVFFESKYVADLWTIFSGTEGPCANER